jgi:hypothetical protein
MIPSQHDKIVTPQRLKEAYKMCEDYCTVTNVDVIGGVVYFSIVVDRDTKIYSSVCFMECKLYTE